MSFKWGRMSLSWAPRTSLTSCGLILPKLLCKYTYSLSKIGRTGDRNCPSWDILCPTSHEGNCISNKSNFQCWNLSCFGSEWPDFQRLVCFLKSTGVSLCWPKVSNQTQVYTQSFSYFLPWARIEYHEVSQEYFCKFSLSPFATGKRQQKLVLRRYAYCSGSFKMHWATFQSKNGFGIFWSCFQSSLQNSRLFIPYGKR